MSKYPVLFPKLIVTVLIMYGLLGNTQAQEDSLSIQVQNLVDQAWDLTLAGKDSALVFAKQALQLAKQNNYHFGEATAMESIGLYHELVTGSIEIASDHYFKAIELCETHNLDYISSIYHSLGVMFHSTDSYEKAEQYYSMALEKAKKAGDILLIKKCLINLGAVFSSLEDFEKSERFMKESLEMPVDKYLDYTTLGNLGYLYVKQKRFDEAISVLIEATEKNPENPDPDLNLYFLLHAKTMAKDSSNMKGALSRAKKAAGSGNYGLRDQSLLYRNIADYLAFTGNFKDALFYRDKYIEVFEEIKEKQRDAVVLDMETKYDTERKDTQLKLLTLETEKRAQQTRFYALLALAVFLLAGLVSFFLYKNREKNKLLTKQNLQLEKNVEEINLLLKEIHHRVKNNLQVVTSLLNIQQRTISDKKAWEAIQESKNRIESMGLIHQSFYQNKQLGEINTREYIQNLVKQLFESYQTDHNNIELETKVQEIYLDMDTLVPLGLIINEMLSNTLKHAFKKEERGKISISLEKIKDRFQLQVSDNGTGLSNMASLEKNGSFGFNMIKAFVKKINGQLNLLNSQGTTFQIEFAA